MKHILIIYFVCLFSLIGIAASAVVNPVQTPAESPEEQLRWLQEYLRVDTTNPPGNEQRAVEFFARLLEREGIPFKLYEAAPGRAIIYARLKGNGRLRPLVLLNHLDVVPADRRSWTYDPFGGTIDQGFIIGRGALDMKSLAIAELDAFIQVHRRGQKPNRDLIFLGTADEEAGGGMGAGWMVKNHPELIRDAEYLLTEGGANLSSAGELQYVGVEVTQKVPCWLRLVVTSRPGHGSLPRPDSATNRLIRALERIRVYRDSYRLVPAVGRYFHAVAEFESEDQKLLLRRIEEEIKNPSTVQRLNMRWQALLYNTISITGLRGSDKINVIPPRATAELDCRLLPGEDPARFIANLGKLIADPQIKIERILVFTPAESGEDTELFRGIRAVIHERLPVARVGPAVSTGFTDSHYFRDLGLTCYGFSPFAVDPDDQARAHGNDERISVRSFKEGVLLYREVIARNVY